MNDNYNQLLQEIRQRKNEELGDKFIRLIKAYLDDLITQYINSESDKLHFRQGEVQAIRNLYEDLNYKSKNS